LGCEVVHLNGCSAENLTKAADDLAAINFVINSQLTAFTKGLLIS
jgi:hypothetical protein